MKLFSFLRTFWIGFSNMWMTDIAASHPEAAFEGIIQNRLRKKAQLVASAERVVARRNVLRRQLKEVVADFEENERKLTGAVRINNVKLGGLYLQKKKALESQKKDLEAQLQQMEEASTNIKNDIASYSKDIVALQDKSKRQVARLRSAQAQKEILDSLQGLSIDTDAQLLSKLDETVEAAVAGVEIRQEMDEVANTERQLRGEEKAAEQSGLEAEFEAMRKNYEASQGTHSATTTPPDGGKEA